MKKHFLLLFLIFFACDFNKKQIPDHKIIAQVGKEILSIDDIENNLANFNSSSLQHDVKAKLIKNWIFNSILYQEAIKSGYNLTDDQVFKLEEIKKKFIIKQYLTNRMKNIEVLDKDINFYYEKNKEEFIRRENEFRFSHLFLETKVQAIFEHLRTSENIMETIKKFHIQKSKNGKVINGDVGYLKDSEINPRFLEELNKAENPPKWKRRRKGFKPYKDGKILGPMKIKGGYHFIQILDRKKAGTYQSVDHVKEVIKQRLYIQKVDNFRDEIIKKLKKNYSITNNFKKVN
jgi:parvulin-like peptidyl-prolyl isomerase